MRRQRELRTESINIKLTETEFALIAARATPEWSPTEVARDLLLKAVTAPDPDVVALMAELLSAREATLNALDRLAAGVLTDRVDEDDRGESRPREASARPEAAGGGGLR